MSPFYLTPRHIHFLLTLFGTADGMGMDASGPHKREQRIFFTRHHDLTLLHHRWFFDKNTVGTPNHNSYTLHAPSFCRCFPDAVQQGRIKDQNGKIILLSQPIRSSFQPTNPPAVTDSVYTTLLAMQHHLETHPHTAPLMNYIHQHMHNHEFTVPQIPLPVREDVRTLYAESESDFYANATFQPYHHFPWQLNVREYGVGLPLSRESVGEALEMSIYHPANGKEFLRREIREMLNRQNETDVKIIISNLIHRREHAVMSYLTSQQFFKTDRPFYMQFPVRINP